MTTQAPEGAGKVFSAKDIADAIEKKSGVVLTSRLIRVSWFPTRAVTPTVFQAGQRSPVGDEHPRDIFEIFEDADEIRVYTVSSSAPTALVCLSKHAPIFTLREMTVGAFVDYIANEWSIVEDGQDTAEKERDAVLDYADAVGPLYSFQDFISDVRDGVHREEIEDEEEEEETEEEAETPEGSPTPAPPPPPEPAKV